MVAATVTGGDPNGGAGTANGPQAAIHGCGGTNSITVSIGKGDPAQAIVENCTIGTTT